MRGQTSCSGFAPRSEPVWHCEGVKRGADKLPPSKVALKSKVRPPRERAHFMKLGWATTILIPIRGTQRI